MVNDGQHLFSWSNSIPSERWTVRTVTGAFNGQDAPHLAGQLLGCLEGQGAPAARWALKKKEIRKSFKLYWLVVDLPLWKIWVRQCQGWHPIYEIENKKCSKPPTSICSYTKRSKYCFSTPKKIPTMFNSETLIFRLDLSLGVVIQSVGCSSTQPAAFTDVLEVSDMERRKLPWRLGDQLEQLPSRLFWFIRGCFKMGIW